MTDYIELLKNNQQKITNHKRAIIELFADYKHLDANAITRHLQDRSIKISLATIYRILGVFEENGIITKHNFGDNQAIYELNQADEHHDHLICIKCGGVTEFINQQIEDLQKMIAIENSFKLLSHTLNIYGYCKSCQ